MSTKTLRVWLSVILSVVFLTACSLIRDRAARFPAPDLAAIYGPLRDNLDRNPVILIPGFAGSALVRSDDGRVVWGSFLTEDSLRPSSHQGLRAFALNIEMKCSTSNHRRGSTFAYSRTKSETAKYCQRQSGFPTNPRIAKHSVSRGGFLFQIMGSHSTNSRTAQSSRSPGAMFRPRDRCLLANINP